MAFKLTVSFVHTKVLTLCLVCIMLGIDIFLDSLAAMHSHDTF